jgi:hypothetical protein
VLLSCAIARGEDKLWVGWASISITPDRPVALEGQLYTRVSKYVHDPVTATALTLETRDGGRIQDQAILVSCDLVFIEAGLQDGVRAQLDGKLPGFDLKKLFLHATHTHTGPLMNDSWYRVPKQGVMQAPEYLSWLIERLSKVVIQSWNARQPGGVSWGRGYAVVGHNRRPVYANGQAKMYGPADSPDFDHIETGEDPVVELLYFWNAQAKLTGVLINIACPSQLVEHESYISADFWNDARAQIRARHSADLFVYPMVGAAGDQSPHLIYGQKAEELVRRAHGTSEGEEIGRRIADAVDSALPGASRDIRFDAPLRHLVESVALPYHPITRQQAEEGRKFYENEVREGKSDPMLGLLHKDIADRYDKLAANIQFRPEIHVLRLGDVALASNPFELYLDYGTRIKARSAAVETFIAQLACEYGSYLPTARAIEAGGYSAELWSFRVGPSGGKILVDRTVELIQSLWDK